VGFLVLFAACEETPNTPVEPRVDDPSPVLSDGLRLGCYGWPEREFTLLNRPKIAASLHPGDPAVEFTLATVEGEPHSLSELLATKPVLLVLGSFT
jgi:hypothetical protein